MDLNDVVSSPNRTFSSIGESRYNSLDPLRGQFLWLGVIGSVRDSRGSPDVVEPSSDLCTCSSRCFDPRSDARRFTSGMCKLDSDLLVLRVGELDDLGVGGELGVRPDTDVLGCDSAFRNDGGSFDDGQTRSSADDTTDYV